MFDQLTSFFKDIIIYLIPGIIINICLVTIFDKNIWLLERKSDSVELIMLIISFIEGFILTQFQIIIYHRLSKNRIKYFKYLTDKDNLLKEKIISILQFDDSHFEKFDTRNFCYQFILNNCDPKIVFLIHRSDTFNLFCVSLFIPILIIFLTIFLVLTFSFWLKLLILIPIFFIALYTLLKAAKHFEHDKEKKIYYSFLGISHKQN